MIETDACLQLLLNGKAKYQTYDAITGLLQAYKNNETDEFVSPTIIDDYQGIAKEDVIIFMNYRADRSRQLTKKLLEQNINIITLTQYQKDFDIPVLFPPKYYQNVLGEVLAKRNYHQLRLAETEKYAHVTFFFNGGIETPFKNEDRILIPSPKVTTYDLQPAMSAKQLTEKLVEHIQKQTHDVIICNFANADMVGHTGNFNATVQAIETIDQCLKKITGVLETVDAEMLITADHGNAEQMYNHEKEQLHTAHTSNLVPLVYVGNRAKFKKPQGRLADIAPTLLTLLGESIPEDMTGENLLSLSLR